MKVSAFIYVMCSLALLNGCSSNLKSGSEADLKYPVRCSTVFQEQTINASDLNDNAIAFLFGKDKEPSQYRQTITEVVMIAYGSPVASINCQRWMSVKGNNEARTFDLNGWSFQASEGKLN